MGRRKTARLLNIIPILCDAVERKLAHKQIMNMNRIALLLIASVPCTLWAHPCPYNWNIEFSRDTEIKGRNLSDFVAKFNEAAKKETKGKIAQAILIDPKPDSFLKVPENSPHSVEMDLLIKRYSEASAPLIKKGLLEYGTAPITVRFPAKFPVACLLAGTFGTGVTGFDETEEGARVTRSRAELECRAYQVNAKFIETAKEWQKEDRIPKGEEAAAYIFASFSGMTWAFYTLPDPKKDFVENSILKGVTLCIPAKGVVLAIETKAKHEEMTKTLLERQFLEDPGSDGTGKTPQPSDNQKQGKSLPATDGTKE